jgi:hypothetical protein
MLGQIMRETIQPCINYFKEFGTFVGEGWVLITNIVRQMVKYKTSIHKLKVKKIVH